MDILSILLLIVLILAAIVGLGLIILIAIAIKTVFELFAVARTVHTEVRTIGSAVKAVAERFSGSTGGVLGVLDFFKGKKKKAAK